jgi:tetratricopeptide (TPR) repeat protein
MRLAGSLSRFWYIRGMLSEGRRRLEEILAAGTDAPAAVRAKALSGAALLAHAQGDYARAPALAEESLALYRQTRDKRGILAGLDVMGIVAEYREDFRGAERLREESLALARELGDKANAARALVRLGNLRNVDPARRGEARGLIEEGLALYRELGDTGGIASSLRLLAIVLYKEGQRAQAKSLLERSVALSRELGDKGGVAFSTLSLSFQAMNSGDFEAARALGREGHALYTEVGNKWGIAGSLGFLGYLAFRDGDYDQARALARESLVRYRELQEPTGAYYALLVLVMVAEAREPPERAARLLGIAEGLRGRLFSTAWLIAPFSFDHGQHASALRQRLGAAAFEALHGHGKALRFPESITDVLADSPGRS